MKCNDLDLLHAYLLKKQATVTKGPVDNKQTLYRMSDGSVVAVYETGTVAFQGTAVSPWPERVTNLINALNA